MAAQEQQFERVVRGGRGTGVRIRGKGLLTLASGRVAAPGVDETPVGDTQQPRRRVVRRTCGLPLCGGCEERLLHRVLSVLEVSSTPYQREATSTRKKPASISLVSAGNEANCSRAVRFWWMRMRYFMVVPSSQPPVPYGRSTP
jgi:hypothetical protein